MKATTEMGRRPSPPPWPAPLPWAQPQAAGWGPGHQAPHLLLLLLQDGLVLEVRQLGEPCGFLGPGPASAHLLLQLLLAEAGLLGAVSPWAYVGLSQKQGKRLCWPHQSVYTQNVITTPPP